MAIRKMDSQPNPERPVTPMPEIRRHKGMRLEEYVELYPAWADWMRNSEQLMYDADGGAWVPRWNPELGVGIGWEDDEEFTPDHVEGLITEAKRALDEVRSGRYYTLDDLDAEDGISE